MKKTFTFLCLLLIACSGTFAQQRRPSFGGGGTQLSVEERIAKQVEELAPTLMLDDVQKKLLEITLIKHAKTRTDLVRNTDLTREKIQDSLANLRPAQLKEIENLLIPEQYELYMQIEKENREKRQSQFGNRSPNQN
ncbi:MAG: hypothetical protein KKC03_00840 [Bacteroidetes bacterium]|nr:hypothetical protein [Bacteroidota bacterium]